MSRPLLALRADGGPGVGSGHLARCLALAEEWTRRGDAVLVSDVLPAPWGERARAAGVGVVRGADAPPAPDWWVVDSYRAPPALRSARGRWRATIDDHDTAGTGGAGADLVVDQNLGAIPDAYPQAAGPVLAGVRYALLRRELVEAAEAVPTPPLAPHVVLLPGGAPSAEVRAAFAAVGRRLGVAGIGVEVLDGTAAVVPALRRATVAVAAAGSTSWELGLLGVPSVVVPVADNQRPLAAALDVEGAAVAVAHLDPSDLAEAARDLVHDGDRRQALAAQGRALVDGWGTRRVATEMRSRLLSLRPAVAEDCATVHRWNDDPVVRAASFSPEPIPFADHERWFATRLADPATTLLIGHDPDGRPLGVVRGEHDGARVELSVALDAERRDEGWGPALIAAACGVIDRGEGRGASDAGAAPVALEARIKVDNPRSARAFRAADFDLIAEADGVGLYRRSVRSTTPGPTVLTGEAPR